MRVGLIGVSHWHAVHYYGACARMPGIDIVGVSDPDRAALHRVSSLLDARAFADYRDLIQDTKPDFAFVLGPHDEVASRSAFLIEHNVPHMVEKPAGINAAEVIALRDQAAARGTYVTTGFNFLVSDFVRMVDDMVARSPMTAATFRFVGPGIHRYRETGCSWMLDPVRSGGGSTRNLSVHFFDMFRRFGAQGTRVTGAAMGNHTFGLPIEDQSAVVLRADNATCTVETGYTSPNGWDLRFGVRTRRECIIARADDVIEHYRGPRGELTETRTPSVANAHWYPAFVEATLDRFAKGQVPLAGLDELVPAVQLVDAAYAADAASKSA